MRVSIVAYRLFDIDYTNLNEYKMNPAMRKSAFVLLFFIVGILLMMLTAADAAIQQDLAMESLGRRTLLVKELGLSDIALFTEARYTRHPSLADRHAAFQDHPVSFDHFPSGSLYLPPRQLVE